MAHEPDLELITVTKRFGSFTAVRDVSLVVERGQFLCDANDYDTFAAAIAARRGGGR